MMVLASGARRRITIRTTSAIKYTAPLGGKVPAICPWLARLDHGQCGVGLLVRVFPWCQMGRASALDDSA